MWIAALVKLEAEAFSARPAAPRRQLFSCAVARKAAEWRAQNNLGHCYAEGIGVEQDHAQAVLWYRKAAEQGNTWAQHNLGCCYEEGRGVEQDHAQAVLWYHKAADQDNAGVQNYLGVRYAEGIGVEQDHAQAMVWYRKQRNKGTLGQEALGLPQIQDRKRLRQLTEIVGDVGSL